MGKYDKASYRTPPPERPWKIHPIWRGIGCVWLLISPVLAYAIASLLVRFDIRGGYIPFSPELLQTVVLPFGRLTPAEIKVYLPIKDLAVERLFANLLVSGLILLIGFGVIMVAYAIIYAVSGPKRLGPLDAPPIRRKTRKSR